MDKGVYYPSTADKEKISVGAERQRRYRAMKRWRADPTEENVWGVVLAYAGVKFKTYSGLLYVIIYWDNGMVFYDKDGNEIVQLPRQAIEQMSVNNRKITIPWDGVEYKIVRNPFDNEKEVQEMLAFYGKDR